MTFVAAPSQRKKMRYSVASSHSGHSSQSGHSSRSSLSNCSSRSGASSWNSGSHLPISLSSRLSNAWQYIWSRLNIRQSLDKRKDSDQSFCHVLSPAHKLNHQKVMRELRVSSRSLRDSSSKLERITGSRSIGQFYLRPVTEL